MLILALLNNYILPVDVLILEVYANLGPLMWH